MTSGLVDPAYGSGAGGPGTIGDVLPSVAAALGAPLGPDEEPAFDLPPAPAYVVLLVDGLGLRLLHRYAYAAPYLASLTARPATAGVPSTTATSLTSLGTGLPPGAHGLVGFTVRIPGTNRLLNHLQWSKDVDPLDWQPHPTLLGRLAGSGVHVTTVNKREFAGSGLTVASSRGAAYVGADRVGEQLAAAVAASSRPPSLTYLYEGDLDWTGHRFGVASAAWLQQLAMTDAMVEQLRDALPATTRLLVIADHGMVDSPPAARVDVDRVPGMTDGLALLGGEARFRHLYAVRGAADDLAAAWRSVLGDRATVLTRDEAIERGWFGPVDPQVRPRLGDLVVAAHGETAVMSSRAFAYETTLVGLHGSLTPDEMEIPLLVG